MRDTMTKLEKAAITSAVSGTIFNVFLFSVGATLADATGNTWLFYLRGLAAVIQAAEFDLVAIATVMGMRAGRRSGWSYATAGAASLVAALIALDVAAVWHQPWLHAANALIVLAFTLHLLTPRAVPQTPRAYQLRAIVRRLCAIVRHERATVDQLTTLLHQAQLRMSQMEDAARQSVPVEVIVIGERQLSLRQLSAATDIPLTTLRRRVAALAGPATGEA